MAPALLALALAPVSAHAQQRDSLRVAPTAAAPADTLARLNLSDPPLSPRRAFLTSLALPGYAQARLERPIASALFFSVEASAVLMLRKALHDLSVARRFEGDSLPATYQRDAATGAIIRDPETGAPLVATWTVGRFTPGLVAARRTHVEDWVAVLVFNHLLAGADAFVAAQLWEVPEAVRLSAAPGARGGAVIRASIRW